MKTSCIRRCAVIPVLLSLLALTGCFEVLSAVATSTAMTAEYVINNQSSKTMTYGLRTAKKALLVALCKMEIPVNAVQEIESGEEITAETDTLKIRIELKEITPSVTRIAVVAEKQFMIHDRATAEEILRQATDIVERING